MVREKFTNGGIKMKEILHIQTNDKDEFVVNVPGDVTEQELSFGLMDVMYNLIVKDMRQRHIRLNKRNFDKMFDTYGKATTINLGVMYDIKHRKENMNRAKKRKQSK